MFFTSIFCGSLFCGSAVHILNDLIELEPVFVGSTPAIGINDPTYIFSFTCLMA